MHFLKLDSSKFMWLLSIVHKLQGWLQTFSSVFHTETWAACFEAGKAKEGESTEDFDWPNHQRTYIANLQLRWWLAGAQHSMLQNKATRKEVNRWARLGRSALQCVPEAFAIICLHRQQTEMCCCILPVCSPLSHKKQGLQNAEGKDGSLMPGCHFWYSPEINTKRTTGKKEVLPGLIILVYL